MTEPPAPAEPSRLPILTSLRWYAALLVFLYHYLLNSDLTLLRPLGFGYVGVAFFFILSGFVLTWSARTDISRQRFWWNRFARVYPSHLVMFLIAVALFHSFPQAVEETGAGRAITQALLIQSWWPNNSMGGYNGVSWSLANEAFFYLCFPLFVVIFLRYRRAGTVATLLALLLGLVFAAYAAGDPELAKTAYFNPLARLPEFLLGMWLALRVRARTLPRIPIWAAAGLCVALGIITWRIGLAWYPATNYLVLPGLVALIVAGAQHDAAGELNLATRVLRHKVSIWLGEVSFAFYLVHEVVIIYARPGFESGDTKKAAFLVLCFALSLVGATALHLLVEKPVRRWLLARGPGRAPRQRSVDDGGRRLGDLHASEGLGRPGGDGR